MPRTGERGREAPRERRSSEGTVSRGGTKPPRRQHPERAFFSFLRSPRKGARDNIGAGESNGLERLDPAVVDAVMDLPPTIRDETLRRLRGGTKVKLVLQPLPDDEAEDAACGSAPTKRAASVTPKHPRACPFRDAPPMKASPSVVAFSQTGALNYGQKVGQQFYACFGLFPECADPGELPRMADLRRCKPADCLRREVIQVDITTDQQLQQLRADVFRDLLGCAQMPSAVPIAVAVAAVVSDRLGGRRTEAALADQYWTWAADTQATATSVVLPLGSLLVGLSRHRALLTKLVLEWLNVDCAIMSAQASLPAGPWPTDSGEPQLTLLVRDRSGANMEVHLMERAGEVSRLERPLAAAARPIERGAHGAPAGTRLGPAHLGDYTPDACRHLRLSVSSPSRDRAGLPRTARSSGGVSDPGHGCTWPLRHRESGEFGGVEPASAGAGAGAGLPSPLCKTARSAWASVPSPTGVGGELELLEELPGTAAQARARARSERLSSPQFGLERPMRRSPGELEGHPGALQRWVSDQWSSLLRRSCGSTGGPDERVRVSADLVCWDGDGMCGGSDSGQLERVSCPPGSEGTASAPLTVPLASAACSCPTELSSHLADAVAAPPRGLPGDGGGRRANRPHRAHAAPPEPAPRELRKRMSLPVAVQARGAEDTAAAAARAGSGAAAGAAGPPRVPLAVVVTLPVERMQEHFHLWIPPRDVRLTDTALGHGRYGQVALGTFRTTRVAVKTLHYGDQRELGQAMREMLLLQALQFEHIVRFYGAVMPEPDGEVQEEEGLQPASLYLCMGYMPYGDVCRILHDPGYRKQVGFPDERLCLRTRLEWALGVVSALDLLHSRGVVHGDLKSRDVLIGGQFEAALADFGMARVYERPGGPGSPSHCRASAPKTIYYAAPEVLRSDQVSPASEMFSFGCLLWELLTMQEPWREMAGNTYDIMCAVIHNRRTLDVDAVPEGTQSEVPGAVAALRKCLEYAPEHRPAAADMHRILSDALETMPG